MRTLTILIVLVAGPAIAATRTNATIEHVGSESSYTGKQEDDKHKVHRWEPNLSSSSVTLLAKNKKGEFVEVELAGAAVPEKSRKEAYQWLTDKLVGKKVFIKVVTQPTQLHLEQKAFVPPSTENPGGVRIWDFKDGQMAKAVVLSEKGENISQLLIRAGLAENDKKYAKEHAKDDK